MSDTTNQQPIPPAPAPQATPSTPEPVAQAKTESAPPKSEAPPDTSAAMRTALLRAQVTQVLGAVQAPWVVDAVIAATKPDLLADYTGLTGPSRERVNQWKAENAFAFAQTQPAAPAAPVAQPQALGAPVQQPKTEPLPATPSSTLGTTGGLSQDDLRRLSAVHVDPKAITAHPDWNRVKAFWGMA